MNLKAAISLLVGSSLGMGGALAMRSPAQRSPPVVVPAAFTPAPAEPPPAPARSECSLDAAAETLSAPQGVAVVSGTAGRLSLPWGEVYVMSGGAPVRVWAAPWELANLIPGEKVRVRYDDYGAYAWLDATGAGPDLETFARFGALRGTVRWVHKTLGEVSVRLANGTRVFRARPEVLAKVLPGQAVTFRWVRVGGVDWWSAPPDCAAP